MNTLIEEYLHTRGVRYFRGHHDDEYFYIAEAPDRSRLYVHLEVCGAGRDAVQISITPDRYLPAQHSDRLHEVVARWNSECHAVGALVLQSCDPSLVGVSAGSRFRGTDRGEFGSFVEGSHAAAAELFGSIRGIVPPAEPPLRRAG